MSSVQSGQPGTPPGGRGLGLSLIVIATAQLMLVLDDTIANIALPSIQREMAVSAATLPWIINAHILAFGGLLLFGGRLGDLFGRRRVFRAGLGLFPLASLLGGLGVNAEMLIGARALQGIGAALTAPNALALIATNFPVGKPRNSAMTACGAMSALGIAVGVLLGGVLTGTLGWRWVFFINIPIGLAVLAGSGVLAEGERNAGRLDTPGALTGTGATVALTYGITHAAEHGWGDAVTLGALGAALVLALLFLWLQARGANPMLPLGIFRSTQFSAANAVTFVVYAALMAAFFLLPVQLQEVLGYSPMGAGLALIPDTVLMLVLSARAGRLAERIGPRVPMSAGPILAAAGLALLATVGDGSSYLLGVLPGLVVFGLGLSLTVAPLTATVLAAAPA